MNSVSSDPVQELYKVIDSSSATFDEKNGIKNCLNLVLLQQDYKLNTIKENVIVALNFDYGIGDTSTAMPMSMPSSASAAAAGTSSAAAAAAAAGTTELSLRQRHYHRACHDDAPSNYDAFKITKNEEERYRNTHTSGTVLSIDRISELLTGLITQSTPMYIVSEIKLLQFSYKLPKGKSVYIRFRTDLNDEFRNKLQTGRPMVTVLLRLMHEIASLHAYNFTADNGIVKRKDFTNSSHSKKEDNKKKKQEEEESCYDIITQNFNTNLARFRDMRRYNKCLREFQGCIVNCHHNDVDSFLQANPNWKYRSNNAFKDYNDDDGLTCELCCNDDSKNDDAARSTNNNDDGEIEKTFIIKKTANRKKRKNNVQIEEKDTITSTTTTTTTPIIKATNTQKRRKKQHQQDDNNNVKGKPEYKEKSTVRKSMKDNEVFAAATVAAIEIVARTKRRTRQLPSSTQKGPPVDDSPKQDKPQEKTPRPPAAITESFHPKVVMNKRSQMMETLMRAKTSNDRKNQEKNKQRKEKQILEKEENNDSKTMKVDQGKEKVEANSSDAATTATAAAGGGSDPASSHQKLSTNNNGTTDDKGDIKQQQESSHQANKESNGGIKGRGGAIKKLRSKRQQQQHEQEHPNNASDDDNNKNKNKNNNELASLQRDHHQKATNEKKKQEQKLQDEAQSKTAAVDSINNPHLSPSMDSQVAAVGPINSPPFSSSLDLQVAAEGAINNPPLSSSLKPPSFTPSKTTAAAILGLLGSSTAKAVLEPSGPAESPKPPMKKRKMIRRRSDSSPPTRAV